MVNKYYITEWLSSTDVADLKVWIYQLPLKDIEKRHTDISKVKFHLQRINKFQTIVYNDTYIASFEEIKNWGDHAYISGENRVINLTIHAEVSVLERLIKQYILQCARKANFRIGNGSVMLQPRELQALDVTPYLSIDITISNEGAITLGFDSAHHFTYKETLYERMQQNKAIEKGIRVTDYTLARSYEYTVHELAPYTINEKSPILNQSIIEYYTNKTKHIKLNI